MENEIRWRRRKWAFGFSEKVYPGKIESSAYGPRAVRTVEAVISVSIHVNRRTGATVRFDELITMTMITGQMLSANYSGVSSSCYYRFRAAASMSKGGGDRNL